MDQYCTLSGLDLSTLSVDTVPNPPEWSRSIHSPSVNWETYFLLCIHIMFIMQNTIVPWAMGMANQLELKKRSDPTSVTDAATRRDPNSWRTRLHGVILPLWRTRLHGVILPLWRTRLHGVILPCDGRGYTEWSYLCDGHGYTEWSYLWRTRLHGVILP